MSTWAIYERKTSNDDMPFSLSIEERDDVGLYIWPNWHKEIEIMYVSEGCAKIVLEQQEYHLEKGNIIIVNADELHSAYCEVAPCSCKVITLDPKYIIKNTLYQALLIKPLLIKDEIAVTYIEKIFEEFLEQSYGYMDTSKAYLTLLIVYLYRTYSQKSASDSAVQKRNVNLERLNNVFSYIDQHYTEEIGNKTLADMMYLSENRFIHLFRKSTGIPPQRYITTLRLEKAKELILSTNHTITEIARIVGFHDYNQFGRQFLKHHGYTPRELKKQKVPTKHQNKGL